MHAQAIYFAIPLPYLLDIRMVHATTYHIVIVSVHVKGYGGLRG
jgi:hypothetical protein